jgi:hypothetical protein
MYKKRTKLNISKSYSLDESNPVIQNMVISMFKQNKIPVYRNTNEYDLRFPYLFWDVDSNCLSQTSSTTAGDKTPLNLENFLNLFFLVKQDEPTIIKLNSDYEAKVTSETVRVGCQEISADVVLKIADEIKRLRDV